MSRYMDIKKLTDKDREIFVLRLAQVCPLTKLRLEMRRKDGRIL